MFLELMLGLVLYIHDGPLDLNLISNTIIKYINNSCIFYKHAKYKYMET